MKTEPTTRRGFCSATQSHHSSLGPDFLLAIPAKAAYRTIACELIGAMVLLLGGVAAESQTGPAITSQPVSLAVTAGQNATFTVVATGAAPLCYQWYLNTDTALAGATNTSLTLTNVNSSQAGWYSVVVTNLSGSVTSGFAILTVTPAATTITVQPAGNQGFNLYANGALAAPIQLAANGVIVADNITSNASQIYLSGLRCTDPLAVSFATNDFVSITVPSGTNMPVVQFQLTIVSFNTNHWLALFPGGAAPFHFLTCAMPSAEVWHQRGWLNATPLSDPFPLLEDVHNGSPQVSCLWNRNWSSICPLGAHPIPMIGLWNPDAGLYVGYDFQGARATDHSERYIATAYCWQQGALTNFITLAYPYGGFNYVQQVYPQAGQVLSSWFELEVNPSLPSTQDPNEQFQERLFTRYTNSLPPVPAMNDLAWLPGQMHLGDFAGPEASPMLYETDNAGSEQYPPGTVVMNCWYGHVEMPIDTSANNNDTNTIASYRSQVESLMTNYGIVFPYGGDTCMYWQKPLAGSWYTNWGGTGVTTLHETEGWYVARVLVELYRYDLKHGQARTNYLTAIDQLFNWEKHITWTRNEFIDVPATPFEIGCTLSEAFLMDYYYTFRNDPVRGANAALALDMADKRIWRYMPIWAMDSDPFDCALDSAFLLEPNSGCGWTGQACANEASWCIDAMTQVYVNTGDPRMRYYLRGILQRWPVLYQQLYEPSIAAYTQLTFTEGLGLFDGATAGRGLRLNYGNSQYLPVNDPIGYTTMRVTAGAQACIAFDRLDQSTDITNYQTTGNGACSFGIVSGLQGGFDVSFSYPFVNIAGLPVTRTRGGVATTLTNQIQWPAQSPSSLWIWQCQNGDVINIGGVPAGTPTNTFDTSLVYNEANVQPVTNGSFYTLPLSGNYLLPQSWTNLNSFAGIVPGLHWNYGIPYQQKLHGVTNTVAVNAPGATVVLVAYAPPFSNTLAYAPSLTLDNSSTLKLSGQPVPIWRAWPEPFNETVLMDFAALPAGRSAAQINPNGAIIMGATAFTGGSAAWPPIQNTLTNASASFVYVEAQRLRALTLQSNYAALPAGRIAVLPLSGGGAGRYFAAETGLDQKWDMLTEQQLVNSNWFNPANYPMAFFLGGEDYVDTVNTTGDGKAAVTSYLANGGTLVILPNGAWPFFYGYGPNDQPGPPDPLLTAYGLPIESLEQPAPGTFMQLYTNQTVVQSVPVSFPYPPGDQRLRSFNMIAIPPADYYEHFIRAVDTNGNYYGDVAAYVSFGTGPANGGNLLYVWDTLLEGPQGQDVLADTVTWILNAVFPTSNPPSGPTLNPQNYGSWMHVSFSGYDQGGTLSNFPALVRLGTNLPGFSYEQFASPTGGDLRFTDASGSTLIPHEIDEWNTNGTSYVWVQVPALSGPTNSIWAYWGNAAAANPLTLSTNGAVWATNYNLVWHLKEGGFPYADSAQQHPAAAGSSPASTTGVVGKGCLFSGSQFLDAGTVKLGAQFTLSAWVNVAANANDIQVIWANASPGYKPGFALYVNSFLTGDKELRLDVDDGTTGGGTASSTNAVGFGQWHLITAAISQWSGVGTLYVDGTAVAGGSYLGTALTDFPLDADLNLGCFTNGASQFNGTMDEVRVQSSMASPNWVWASWMTVASNAVFSSYASVTPNPPVILPSINATGRNNGLLLSWPASGVGYALYMTTNLAAPSSWSLVTNAPVLVTSNNVTQWQLPVSTTTSAAGYYQLKAQ